MYHYNKIKNMKKSILFLMCLSIGLSTYSQEKQVKKN